MCVEGVQTGLHRPMVTVEATSPRSLPARVIAIGPTGGEVHLGVLWFVRVNCMQVGTPPIRPGNVVQMICYLLLTLFFNYPDLV